MDISIKNFRQVNDWFYRGAQPEETEIQTLADLGIKTVINLRSTKSHIEKERSLVEALGMNFVSIPMTYLQSPTHREIRRFLELTDDSRQHPLFLHCLHGADRTGVLVAIYRLSREGWDVKDAFQEMKDGGWHRTWMFHYEYVISAYAWLLKKQWIK